MTLELKTNFLHYFDFLSIAIDAYKSSQAYIYKKILSTLANKLHNNCIELEKISLKLEQGSKFIYDYDLESTHDSMLDSIEDVKLLKSKIKKIDINEFEFTNLYNQADEAHNAMIDIIEKLAYLEIEELKKEKAA